MEEFSKTEDNKQYLDNYLKQFKTASEVWLNNYKKGLDSQLNSFFLNKIQEAEQAIEKATKEYAERLSEDLQDIEIKRKEYGPIMKNALDRMEKSAKDTFETGLRMTTNLWKSFIENCKNKMK